MDGRFRSGLLLVNLAQVMTRDRPVSMGGVVAAAEPVSELQRRQEEVDGARHDVQVGQPRLGHVAPVKVVRGYGASGQMRHVDQQAFDDGQGHDCDQQDGADLNSTEPFGAGRHLADHGPQDMTRQSLRARIRAGRVCVLLSPAWRCRAPSDPWLSTICPTSVERSSGTSGDDDEGAGHIGRPLEHAWLYDVVLDLLTQEVEDQAGDADRGGFG